ncbi:MAG: hypothetical protein RIB30_06010 [Thalassospira sp.]
MTVVFRTADAAESYTSTIEVSIDNVSSVIRLGGMVAFAKVTRFQSA